MDTNWQNACADNRVTNTCYSKIVIPASVMAGLVFQAKDGIRDLGRCRGRGDGYMRQTGTTRGACCSLSVARCSSSTQGMSVWGGLSTCPKYTSDAADDPRGVDLGVRPIIEKQINDFHNQRHPQQQKPP